MTRLDVWLDVACVFKTRSEAQRACKNGKVSVNGQPAKPHRELGVGERIEVSRPQGRHRQLVVTGLADTHLPKVQARTLYEDVTPPPTADELELRELLRRAGPVPGAKTGRTSTPNLRERRALRQLKQR